MVKAMGLLKRGVEVASSARFSSISARNSVGPSAGFFKARSVLIATTWLATVQACVEGNVHLRTAILNRPGVIQ